MTVVEFERKKLVEALFGNKILNQNKWKEISLPTRHGGLGINVSSLIEDSNTQYRKCEVVIPRPQKQVGKPGLHSSHETRPERAKKIARKMLQGKG